MSRHETRPAGLVVRGLSKFYGRTAVMRDASLRVEPGEVVCLTGDNGAGKSTLLKCLVGLSRFRGSAELDGRPLPNSAAALAEVGYLPQAPGLVDTATVGETIEFFSSLRGDHLDPAKLPEGFLPGCDERVGRLSGGQRQRVALAMLFLVRSRLLLLDEPIANLDDAGRSATRRLIADAAAAGASVVIVSPAAADLASIIDRTLMLRDGVVLPVAEMPEPAQLRPARPEVQTTLPIAFEGTPA